MYNVIEELENYQKKLSKAISFYENVKHTLGSHAEKKLVSFVYLLCNDPSLSDKALAVRMATEYLTPTQDKCIYNLKVPFGHDTCIAWDEVNFSWYIHPDD